MPFVPSGEQFEIRAGEHRAVVVEVGGGIREYEVAGRPVLEPYPEHAMADGAHGQSLVPWPNRLADGRYTWDGEEQQVAISEPPTRTAIHGLARWASWRNVEQSGDRVVMATRINPQPGYPFGLEVRNEYELDSKAGLRVVVRATNVGTRALPYATGHHPYLSPGSGHIDSAHLQLDAALRLETDERQLPTQLEPVQGTEYDFRAARPIGGLHIDYAFSDLQRDRQGFAWARLTGNDGATAAIWVGDYSYLEIFTGDTLAPARRRTGLGVEPMTCSVNGFNTGDGLIRLQPGDSVSTAWGATLL